MGLKRFIAKSINAETIILWMLELLSIIMDVRAFILTIFDISRTNILWKWISEACLNVLLLANNVYPIICY